MKIFGFLIQLYVVVFAVAAFMKVLGIGTSMSWGTLALFGVPILMYLVLFVAMTAFLVVYFYKVTFNAVLTGDKTQIKELELKLIKLGGNQEKLHKLFVKINDHVDKVRRLKST